MNTRLIALAARTLNVEAETLSPASNRDNTPQWDSGRHIELLLAVEKAFRIEFSMGEIGGINSLADLNRAVEGHNVVREAA